MALTDVQIAGIKTKVDDLWDILDPLDRADMESVSTALDVTKSALAGSGTDTSEGHEFILIMLGDKT